MSVKYRRAGSVSQRVLLIAKGDHSRAYPWVHPIENVRDGNERRPAGDWPYLDESRRLWILPMPWIRNAGGSGAPFVLHPGVHLVADGTIMPDGGSAEIWIGPACFSIGGAGDNTNDLAV